MTDPEDLASCQVAIVGLGLMGGSLAMALRGKCAKLLGVDSDIGTLSLALERKIVDQVADHPGELLPEADLVILATPVRVIIEYLGNLSTLHPGRACILDIGSTKTEILQAMQGLPDRFDPIGGHPICGKERSSLAYADPVLYQGARFVFVPLFRTSKRALSLATQIADAIRAIPLWIDPETHDRWVAATSHLPYLLSSLLASATPLEAQPLVGPGFRSTTRLAGSSPEMMLDILATNRLHVLKRLEYFRQQLESVEESLAQSDWTTLKNLLVEGAACYEELIKN